MNEPLTLGHWMKRLRAERDLTQEALATELGCAVQTVRTLETGRRRPSRELAERLAIALQVAPEQRAAFVRLARAPTGRAPAASAPIDAGVPPQDAPVAPVAPSTSSGSAAGGQAATQQALAAQPAVLRTKLYVPQPRAERVPRPRLLARLNRGLAGPLTVITAPAGFGKTTLLADWLASAPQAAQVAWLALDPADSDPRQFLRYLVAALQTVAPAVGRSTVTLLHAAQSPPLETLLPLLLNDLLALPDQTVLVLDDYHAIDAPAVHQALAFLLDHLPPHVHLVIAIARRSAAAPVAVARARAADRAARCRPALYAGGGGAVLTRGHGVAAERRTRWRRWGPGRKAGSPAYSWPRCRCRIARIEQRRSSSPRLPAAIASWWTTWSMKCSSARRPTCKRFCSRPPSSSGYAASLCDALLLGRATEETTGEQTYSQPILEQLEHSNLFIVPLDDVRRWYRYHHLFAQMLGERLRSGATAEVVATLHRRASTWFERQGLVVEAVQHALAAHDWERAAGLIEMHGQLLLARGQVPTVLGWLNTLPATVAQAHPFLDVIHAGALFNLNQLAEAEHRVQAAERSLSADATDDPSSAILGTTALIRAYIALFRGELARWLALARQALDILPAAAAIGRTSAPLDIASGFVISGDVTAATEQRLAAAVAAERDMGDLATLFRGMVTLAELRWRQGRLHQAAATYREAARLLPDPVMLQATPSGANYYFGFGGLLCEGNDLAAAEDLLAQGRDMVRGKLLAEADATTRGYIALARLQQARGARSAAMATLHELEAVARERSFAPRLIEHGAAARGELALRQGDLAAAVHWAERSGLRVDDDLSYLHEPEHVTLARLRITMGRQNPAGPALGDALRLLDRLVASAETGGRIDSVIEIVLLRALALHAQGERDRALSALERALALAAPEGTCASSWTRVPPWRRCWQPGWRSGRGRWRRARTTPTCGRMSSSSWRCSTPRGSWPRETSACPAQHHTRASPQGRCSPSASGRCCSCWCRATPIRRLPRSWWWPWAPSSGTSATS